MTLWCDREHLGVSMCEWAASTLQLLKDTKRTDGEPTKKKLERLEHSALTGMQMYNILKPVQNI